jgi:hypothetical protein
LHHSASQGCIFACGSMVLSDLLCAVFRASRGKTAQIEKASTAVPKAQRANCVRPELNGRNNIFRNWYQAMRRSCGSPWRLAAVAIQAAIEPSGCDDP